MNTGLYMYFVALHYIFQCFEGKIDQLTVTVAGVLNSFALAALSILYIYLFCVYLL